MESGIKSPLEVAYNRLDEAHRAWHLALAGYHKISDFRAGINSAIQALRNATFALQKQKENLPGFDIWYAPWQDKMRKDFILRALHDARNVIVKEADLKLKSRAVAKVTGWVGINNLVFEFNPMSDSYSVAKGYYDNYLVYLPIKDKDKKRLIFCFERMWIYEKLPDYELLDAVGYTYKFLWNMLKDAENSFHLLGNENFKNGDYCSGGLTKEGLLTCMNATRGERILNFGLEKGELYRTIVRQEIITEEMKAKVAERYGDNWKSEGIESMVKNFFTDEYPFNDVKKFIQVAITSIKKDKFLAPVSFIFCKKSIHPSVIVHTFRNQAEKLLSIHRVADEIIRCRGTSTLFIGEAWTKKIKGGVNLQDRADRKEEIIIYWVSADEGRCISIPFKRKLFGKIIFSDPIIENYNTDDPNLSGILSPLIAALKKIKNLGTTRLI
jgi:hypothetical protein